MVQKVQSYNMQYQLPDGWVETSLGEIVGIQPGFAFKSQDFATNVGLPVIKIKNIQPPIINIESHELVNIASYSKEKLSKFEVRDGEYLIAMTGETIGKVGKYNLRKFAYINQRVCKIVDIKKSDYDFIYYSLLQDTFQKFINTHSFGAAQANISADQIGFYKINLPSFPEQKAIASLLLSFDDKIELLREENKTLEQTAQTIFWEWFGKYVVEDELPEGWRVGSIYQYVDVDYGFPFKSDLFNSNRKGLPIIRIRNLKDGSVDIYTEENCSSNYIVKPGDILAGMDAEFRPVIWKGEKSLLNQRVCRFRPKNGAGCFYVLELMRPYLDFYEKTKIGTTVSHLGKQDLDRIEAIIPDRKVVQEYSTITDPLFQKIINNNLQIQSLSQTRDELLPRLMRGEVRTEDFSSIIS